LNFANFYDNDVTAIQLYNDIIDFVMILRAGGAAVHSNLKHILEWLVEACLPNIM